VELESWEWGTWQLGLDNVGLLVIWQSGFWQLGLDNVGLFGHLAKWIWQTSKVNLTN